MSWESDEYEKICKADLTDEELEIILEEKKKKEMEERNKKRKEENKIIPIEYDETNKPGRPKGDKWILTPHMMMEKLMEKKNIILKHYNGTIFIYEGGRYANEHKGEPVEIYIGQMVQNTFYTIKKRDNNLSNEVDDRYVRNVCGQFERTYHTYDIDIDKNLIGVKNGILNINKYPYELMKPDPSLFTAINIPVKYDPNAVAIKFKKFERDLLIKKYVDEDGNFVFTEYKQRLEEQILTFEEMFGYPLEYGYPIKKANLLLGPTNCGKTTYYNVMHEFYGGHNVAAVSLYDLGDKNRPAEMVGRLVNNVSDIGYNIMTAKTIENFMLYTGGEKKIQVEKKYRDPFLYNPTIKMYFGANYTPYVDIKNVPFLRRWSIITFPNNDFPFDGHFIDKLVTEKEKSGILNLALEGLERTRKNKNFSFKQNVKTIGKLFLEYRQKDENGNDKKPVMKRAEREDKGQKRGSYGPRKNDARRVGDEDILDIGG